MNSFEIRNSKLRTYMNEQGIDAVYVNSPENHFYMSEFNNPDGYLFITKTDCYVFADSRYIEAAKAEANSNCKVCLPGEPTVAEIVAEQGIKVIGFENNRMTVADYEGLKASLKDYSVEFAPMNNFFTEIRSIKTAEEVEYIVTAQRIAEGAFDHICKVLKYDMTEKEVAAELEYYMKKHGSEKESFDTICVSGTASSRPHGVPRPVKLERGFLTMDYGAMINGYHSDMTRTVVIGKADDAMKHLYNTVLSAQKAAMEAVKPGVKNMEIDNIARTIIYGAGYEGKFGHGLGHGVGLEIHEMPMVNMRAGDRILQVGEVITDEPGIYLEGKYGCRIEDMILVTEDGYKCLTNCPHEIIEL